MAWTPRNLLGNGGASKDSALEAALNIKDGPLYGVQLLGSLGNANCFGIQAHEIVRNLGDRWIATEVGTGTKALGAASATLPPYVNLTTGSTQHDNIQLQYAAPQTAGSGTYTAWAPFIAKAGYDINMFARFMVTTTVANAAVLIGIGTIDTTSLASSAISNDDFIGFYKAASATMGGIIRNGGTSSTTALLFNGTSGWTPTVSTWYNVGFKLTGRTSITFYVGTGETYEAVSTSTMTNLPANTEALCATVAVSAGTAAAATLHVQALSVWQEAR